MTKLCTTCGMVTTPKRVTPGSFGLGVLLWLRFLLPGIIYSIWRSVARHDACPGCGGRQSFHEERAAKARAKEALVQGRLEMADRL
jgi:hypothetical protein